MTETTTVPLNPPLVVDMDGNPWLAVALLWVPEVDEKLDSSTQRYTNAVYLMVSGTGRTLLSTADGITSVRPLEPGENPF